MLANFDGNLVPTTTLATPAKQTLDLSPTKEFLNLSSAASQHHQSLTPQPQAISISAIAEDSAEDSPDVSIFPVTPTPASFSHCQTPAEGASFSPTTPYYLSQGSKLIQQTCPPKQSMQSLFPVSGDIDDQPDESVRQRLLLARRKSLQWAPRVGSPLGRPVDFASFPEGED